MLIITTPEDIFEIMGQGYVLLANAEQAFLATNAAWHPDPRPDIPVPYAVALRAIKGQEKNSMNRISALDQFRWHYRVGWREWVGDRGEKFDVFALVQ